ncbi:MAG: histidine ammonia-lyase [bacterium]|nr:histidine ammonia-lyase [bacterium]
MKGAAMIGRVELDGTSLTLEDLERVAAGQTQVALTAEAWTRVTAARAVIEDALRQGKVIYGVTTGFGNFSEVPISPSEVRQLQRNLLLSHAAGVGDPLPEPAVRAMILLRANSLASGYSGVRPEVIRALLDLLEHGLHPVVPVQGSVGASGDLAPLAHVALALIGEGEVFWKARRVPAAEALGKAGLKPLTLEAKEGLALINGTQFMTALGALAVLGADRVSRVADVAAAMTCEALRGTDASASDRFAALRPHPGHGRAAANLRRLLAGSQLVSRPGEIRVQDPYVLRCVPQVHGAGKDVLAHVRQVIERELNAVTDNPLVFPGEGLILSGGNFHGQPLALALDYLAMALAEWADIAERRIERLLNPQLSGLPAFLVRAGGLNSGLMLAQYTAAALVSENKVLCHPASVDSIPTSANQEDHVSMGAIAARKAGLVLANTERVLAIELLCAAQALDFRDLDGAGPAVRRAHGRIRERLPRLEEDRMLSPDIEAVAGLVRSGELLSAVEEVTGSLAP